MDPAATEICWSLHKYPHSNPNPITTNLLLEGASLSGQSTIHYKYRDSGYVTRASLTVSRTGWRLSVRSLRITLAAQTQVGFRRLSRLGVEPRSLPSGCVLIPTDNWLSSPGRVADYLQFLEFVAERITEITPGEAKTFEDGISELLKSLGFDVKGVSHSQFYPSEGNPFE